MLVCQCVQDRVKVILCVVLKNENKIIAVLDSLMTIQCSVNVCLQQGNVSLV